MKSILVLTILLISFSSASADFQAPVQLTTGSVVLNGPNLYEFGELTGNFIIDRPILSEASLIGNLRGYVSTPDALGVYTIGSQWSIPESSLYLLKGGYPVTIPVTVRTYSISVAPAGTPTISRGNPATLTTALQAAVASSSAPVVEPPSVSSIDALSTPITSVTEAAGSHVPLMLGGSVGILGALLAFRKINVAKGL